MYAHACKSGEQSGLEECICGKVACQGSHALLIRVPSFCARDAHVRPEEQTGGAEQRSGAELRSEVRTGGAKRSRDQRSGAGVREPESRAEVEERRGGAEAGIREVAKAKGGSEERNRGAERELGTEQRSGNGD